MPGVLTNPIAYAHLQTRGGIARQFAYAVIFMVVVGSFVALTSYAKGRWVQDSLAGWMYALMAIQFGMALLFASTRINASIRRDLQDEMIDSLRLMPIPASQAVLGYIFAGGLQGGSIMLANLLLGATIATPAGFQVQQWITANVILVFFCMFIWVIVASLSFLMKSAAMVVFGVLSLTGVTWGMPAIALPGLAMVLTPLSGRSILSMRNTFVDLAPQLATATVAQTGIGVLFFIAACRKFRRSDWPGFTAGMGLLLLLAWEFCTLLGFYQFEKIKPDFPGMGRAPDHLRVIASFLFSMLVAMLPIISAVREKRFASRRMRLYPELVTACAILLCMLQMLHPPTFISKVQFIDAAWKSAAGVAVFLACACSMARLLVPQGKTGGWLLAGGLFVGIVIPLVVDGLRGTWYPETGEELTAIGAFSPIGYMVIVWNRMDASLFPALAGYMALIVIFTTLSFRKGNVVPSENL